MQNKWNYPLFLDVFAWSDDSNFCVKDVLIYLRTSLMLQMIQGVEED